MAIKAKTKTSVRQVKKTITATVSEIQPTSIRPNRLQSYPILKNKKIIAIVVVVIAAIILAISGKSILIAAMVNGEPVTRLSVVTALEKQGGKTTLDNLITRKLILQEARKRNVSITQADLDEEVKKITTNLQSQGTTLEQALATQGMTKAELNEELKVQVALNKLVGTDVSLTNKEVDDFVVANKAQMPPGTTEAQFREQAASQLKQQKQQTKIQDLIKSLHDKAKINRFVSY